jgi:hypothetical protein
MNLDIVKEVTIEYIENIYVLATNYLKNNNYIYLKNILEELDVLEERVRICSDINVLDNYKTLLNHLGNKIE